MFFYESIENKKHSSDIAVDSELYSQIADALTDIGLNLAFFTFENLQSSSYARTIDGQTTTCPVLTIYLKFNEDFKRTRIDPHSGNWSDKWTKTRDVRGIVNTIFEDHGLGHDYVSEHTFIFVHSNEVLAFYELGQNCISDVRKMIFAQAPGVYIDSVYWDGNEYYILMRDKFDYKRVKRKVKTNLAKSIPQLLAKKDKEGKCKEYDVTIKFGCAGHVPMNHLRG